MMLTCLAVSGIRCVPLKYFPLEQRCIKDNLKWWMAAKYGQVQVNKWIYILIKPEDSIKYNYYAHYYHAYTS